MIFRWTKRKIAVLRRKSPENQSRKSFGWFPVGHILQCLFVDFRFCASTVSVFPQLSTAFDFSRRWGELTVNIKCFPGAVIFPTEKKKRLSMNDAVKSKRETATVVSRPEDCCHRLRQDGWQAVDLSWVSLLCGRTVLAAELYPFQERVPRKFMNKCPLS